MSVDIPTPYSFYSNRTVTYIQCILIKHSLKNSKIEGLDNSDLDHQGGIVMKIFTLYKSDELVML